MDFEREICLAYESTARWLYHSFTQSNFKGSLAWESRLLHPWRGWSCAYPETTGYIIPTLYDYLSFGTGKVGAVKKAIETSVEWLLSMQLPGGAFPGGHYVSRETCYLHSKDYLLRRPRPSAPSIFNSAQILHGLLRHYTETQDARVLQSICCCNRFLIDCVEPDGHFKIDAYTGTTSPAYFTLVSLRLAEAYSITKDEALRAAAKVSLDVVTSSADRNTYWIPKMGFHGREFAFTHTIAYTIEGLLTSATILPADGHTWRELAANALYRLFRISELNKKVPGGYSTGWSPRWDFECIPGNCQLGLCFLMIFESTGDARYLNAACRIYSSVLKARRSDGAIPGSSPFWGPYMSMRYPNWGAKYFMDFSKRLLEHLWKERSRQCLKET
jgi:hypothetical protein